jgi:excisionase family DNA binding protein
MSTRLAMGGAPPLGGPTRLMTPAQVAERLAVSRSLVYSLVRQGALAAVYVGRLPRIVEAELEDYIARQRENARK